MLKKQNRKAVVDVPQFLEEKQGARTAPGKLLESTGLECREKAIPERIRKRLVGVYLRILKNREENFSWALAKQHFNEIIDILKDVASMNPNCAFSCDVEQTAVFIKAVFIPEQTRNNDVITVKIGGSMYSTKTPFVNVEEKHKTSNGESSGDALAINGTTLFLNYLENVAYDLLNFSPTEPTLFSKLVHTNLNDFTGTDVKRQFI